MRRSRLAWTTAAACAAVVVAFSAGRRADPATTVRTQLSRQIDALDSAFVDLDAHPTLPAFFVARDRYKRLEGALEFYAPALAAAFNSRRQEVDDDDAPPPSTLSASGFPALEAVFYSSLPAARLADSARTITHQMRGLVARVRTFIPALRPTASQLVELTRLEIARVASLGIAGFDTPFSHRAMPEAASALDGLRTLWAVAAPDYWPALAHERAALDARLDAASAALRRDTAFATFDRLAFIVDHVNPTAVALDSLRRVSATPSIRIPRAWRADAPSIYSPNAFDVRAYAPTTAPAPTPALIAEGARLFADPRLSGTGTRSCASCHHPDHAFADSVALEPDVRDPRRHVARNTPTLINAALQPAQFADERAASLEDQALEVLRSPSEMGNAHVDPAATLHARQALAAYVRTLLSTTTRFDRALAGDSSALTAEERRGFNLFMGKAACGTCHFAPLFSGVTPPLYLSSDVEVIGTTRGPSPRSPLDPDSGRARIDHLPNHVRAFKTPTLRNVARTAPYMHNGAFATLEQVLAFYDRGGAAGSGAAIGDQTLSSNALHLSDGERRAIIAFLGALSDVGVRH